MRITWNELTVSMDGVDLEQLLSEWRWLVQDSVQPVLISSLGDLFLRHEDGRILWLDTGTAELCEVASDAAEFKELMVQPENANSWFIPQLVGDILSQGKQLAPGECFSYQVLPALGGKMEPDNFEATDLQVHFSIAGQIHRQLHDLPPGTPIGDISFE
ncbi:DUF1851 domain-containing protein [Tuwongella immobilis]|uniref:T6SS immunity protein Tdi1 C-terminal domain-containing protein n=1 Tax=Tuwongella immobilis TaxID=692036 RepID=A0A6C2YL09_9BACT|nr:DUF1851 domain-containing protein [Tuwongella immobilis]VIP01803.1 Uncharacterized protein OS=Pirellula staleyi (strain ATCC 27377 / DSM 6068 / ICPB 4128) GN=Psta_2086 PE=4 SV=1: DUF1851 [Tuwongella immobilis]VTR99498.1 Uncharacterized protein OS=Pirellula staleyi (strain ATCC 27377 / DSM 6068 / ICPB 4128) GN=Psta_2086 PE=4 SV=1: DUF1851 [Tuwongella immobilis]